MLTNEWGLKSQVLSDEMLDSIAYGIPGKNTVFYEAINIIIISHILSEMHLLAGYLFKNTGSYKFIF
jgi:hypothetical protein